METRAFYVMFLACHFVWLSDSSSPYGTNGNGHDVGKKGYDRDRSYGGEHRSRTSKPRSCTDRFEIKNNYIIRTQESLDNDATFIDALKVETSEMCLERCCDANGGVVDDDGTTVVCDTSVFVDGDYAFENKESNCFIFQCRFDEGERYRCKFSDHDSYVTSMFGGFGVEPYFEEEQEENEKEEAIPQTKQAPTTTQDEWKNDEKEPTDDEDVEDVDECNENQFQCDSGECIRLTLLCDDYDDCQDKSDETDQCATIQDQDVTTHNGSLWKIWRYMYGSSAQDYTTEYPPNADEVNNQVDETMEEPGAETDNESIDLGVPDEDESNDLKSDDNMPVQNDTLHPDQGNPDTTVKPQQTHKANPPSDKGSPTGNTTNNSKSNEDHHASQLPTVHKADKQSVTATAVLPLTIGLFLTMFLLLMMSCRLRYMNRRLRYGRLKTNNVHDADYLINGMYL